MNYQALTDLSINTFGKKFYGKRMSDVPAWYLLWVKEKNLGDPALRKYILENLDALNKEVAKIKR